MEPIAQVGLWIGVAVSALTIAQKTGEWLSKLRDGSRARWFRRYTAVGSEGEEHLNAIFNRYSKGDPHVRRKAAAAAASE